MPDRSKECRNCGMLEEDHHVFEPSAPDGCMCVPAEWGSAKIPDICGKYTGDLVAPCFHCNHDASCHTNLTTSAILNVLERNSGLCMDNEEERKKLASVLAKALK